MTDILKSILQQLNFTIAQQESLPVGSFLASFSSSQKEEYFLVLNVASLNPDKWAEEKLDQSLADLVSFWKGHLSGFSKNVSLLVLWQVLSEEEVENSKRFIFELEEDPYDFKKYVLFYTEPELSAFTDKFSEDGYRLEDLQKELNNPNSFESFKSYLKSKAPSAEETFRYFSLLSRIFIKVPILRTTSQHQEVYDLQNAIDSMFRLKGHEVLQQRLLNLDVSILENDPIDKLITKLCDE
ncbi:hypothetical protein GU926_11105 [Nibribacter ruber]|uniref:Uncharacterized protein n=1 Tax=Nibribacter ruber TaxID=2698458 RepID=A0A6P1P024_9BACT|nr:ABC-three component system middle component 1 [Nibribacter ruber]QHL87949.1 hypothetical protein GU926_11105 [Nibribacter ruber]